MTDLKTLSLGRRIQALRRELGLTQEQLAEQMSITPQAVSKWENDLSCPDILSLPLLAKLLHTTVDTLLTGVTPSSVPAAPPRRPEELIVRMAFTSDDGARYCINLPFTVFRLCAMYNQLTFTLTAEEGNLDAEKIAKAMVDLDFKQIVRLIENGASGTLVDLDCGERLTIWTE